MRQVLALLPLHLGVFLETEDVVIDCGAAAENCSGFPGPDAAGAAIYLQLYDSLTESRKSSCTSTRKTTSPRRVQSVVCGLGRYLTTTSASKNIVSCTCLLSIHFLLATEIFVLSHASTSTSCPDSCDFLARLQVLCLYTFPAHQNFAAFMRNRRPAAYCCHSKMSRALGKHTTT